jgi:RNA polymerase sigma-70 factor (ECF subfamily)
VTDPEASGDAALAQAAAGGDERAYAELVARHKDSLYRLLRRHVGEPEEARDAVQEAFVAAWSALSRYDPSRPFGAWIRTIAINKARDRGRRLAFRRLIFGERSIETPGAIEHPDPAPLADAAMLERERLAALDRAIARLPSALKEALILTALEGRSHQEAAEILGVTPKSVETRAYRARKILAQVLEGPSAP